MITDKQRREVAANIRSEAERRKHVLQDNSDYSPFAALYVVFCGVRGFPHYEDLLHLADLIDHPTCKYVSIGNRRFGCSWCGYVVKLDYDVPVANEDHMPFNYCPHCGAEVVADD